MSIILDSSAFLACLLPDESLLDREQLLKAIANKGVWVPSLFHLEVSNSLLMAERKKRIDPKTRAALLSSIRKLPFNVDLHFASYAFTQIADLAEKENLSVYDATYLELTLRLRGKLASLDSALIQAAKNCNVELF